MEDKTFGVIKKDPQDETTQRQLKEKKSENLSAKILPGNVVDEDELAVFPCQLVRESNSFSSEIPSIWIHRFQHL